MNPFVFWAALITVLFFALGLSTRVPQNVAELSGVSLTWVAVFSLAWTRWVRKPSLWLARLAAGIGVVLLAALIYEWSLRTDVFVICRGKCPPRTGSFWPLLFVWLCGAGLQTFAVWGRDFRLASVFGKKTLRAWLWWSLVVVWTAMCAYVFVRNISTAVVGISLWGAAKVVGGLALAAGMLFVIGWLLSLPGRKGRKQAVIDYEKIDGPARSDILAMIDRHARTGRFRELYLRSSTGDAQVPLAWIGGKPLAPAGGPWPVDEEGNAATFLLQLSLPGVVGGPWKGRLIVVYLVQYGLLARSYSETQLGELVAQSGPPAATLVEPSGLHALAVPAARAAPDGGEEEIDLVSQLIEEVPGLESRLERLTAYPAPVLAKLLAGQAQVAVFGMEDAIFAGGAPAIIQNPHDPLCETCQQPMRFLFQFADVTESFALGDCGVGYVYGCDAHPDFCQGFVDCY